MTVREEDIRTITDTVWANVVRAEATRPNAAEPDLTGTVMTGCVQMGGAWRGAVTIRCSTGLARTVGAAMFETDPAETAGADIRDAIGELANMIGGNIKALLPGPTQLPPLVVEGGKDALTICDVIVLQTVLVPVHGRALRRHRAGLPMSATPWRRREPHEHGRLRVNILIVDDSKAMRLIVRRALRQAGYAEEGVQEAGNGAEALKVIRAKAPDLVLSDWNMPEMSGLESPHGVDERAEQGTVRLRHVGKRTGDARARDWVGALALICKPFDSDKFREDPRPHLQASLMVRACPSRPRFPRLMPSPACCAILFGKNVTQKTAVPMPAATKVYVATYIDPEDAVVAACVLIFRSGPRWERRSRSFPPARRPKLCAQGSSRPRCSTISARSSTSAPRSSSAPVSGFVRCCRRGTCFPPPWWRWSPSLVCAAIWSSPSRGYSGGRLFFAVG